MGKTSTKGRKCQKTAKSAVFLGKTGRLTKKTACVNIFVIKVLNGYVPPNGGNVDFSAFLPADPLWEKGAGFPSPQPFSYLYIGVHIRRRTSLRSLAI